MEQQQWSEWIEWKGGECPIPHAQFGDYELRFDEHEGADETYPGEFKEQYSARYFDECWRHVDGRGFRHVTAYRVRLTAQQPTEPATTESDRDIDLGDGVDENAAMLARDSAGMVKAVEPVPEFELQIEAEEAPGLLVVAPMERLGATRWGAE